MAVRYLCVKCRRSFPFGGTGDDKAFDAHWQVCVGEGIATLDDQIAFGIAGAKMESGMVDEAGGEHPTVPTTAAIDPAVRVSDSQRIASYAKLLARDAPAYYRALRREGKSAALAALTVLRDTSELIGADLEERKHGR